MLASVNYRKPLDYFGRPLDQIKSMFQKGVRLGEEIEALSGFFACYNLRSLFLESSKSLAFQTNIINRLIVCICEDVCYANPILIRDTLPRLILMSKKPDLRNAQYLANVVKTVTKSKKSRWCSHAAAYFRKQEITEVFDLSKPECFTWLVEDENWPDRLETIKNAIKIEPDLFKILFGYYKKSGKKNQRNLMRFIVGLAHFLTVESDQGIFFRTGWKSEEKIILEEVDIVPYLTHDKSMYPEVPDYAVDVHTAKGRSLKRDGKRFRAVGARIENEHSLFKNEEYETVYNNQ
jgi:hypothetical protein